MCLFGTSADPPTGEGGHLGIVRHLASSSSPSCDFDEVRVLPVYRHMYGVSWFWFLGVEMMKIMMMSQSPPPPHRSFVRSFVFIFTRPWHGAPHIIIIWAPSPPPCSFSCTHIPLSFSYPPASRLLLLPRDR